MKIRAKDVTVVANYYISIATQKIITDEGAQKTSSLELIIHFNKKEMPFAIALDDFLSQRFLGKIFEVAGAEAILYGSIKDLRVATQMLSGHNIPNIKVNRSLGFTPGGEFFSQGMLIKPEGIRMDDEYRVDLSGGNFCQRIRFKYPDKTRLKELGAHILKDFLNLKSHDVTFLLLGHMILAPFSSQLKTVLGIGKTALHLLGPSGGGKTFLGTLAMNFFGDFTDRIVSWSSTANSIEAEGFHFRDTLFMVDDFKVSTVDPISAVRILQSHADSHGRARLRSNACQSEPRWIRGLLLSTGEDFVTNVESVRARTIVLEVGPEKNLDAGKRCWEYRLEYNMFLPALIEMVISQKDWESRWQQAFYEKLRVLGTHIEGLSNGLRIASNYAVNWLGFSIFLDLLHQIGVIDETMKSNLNSEYRTIAQCHLRTHSEDLQEEKPTNVMLEVLGQKLLTGSASVKELDIGFAGKGKVVGMMSKDKSTVKIFPDLLSGVLSSHFREINQKLPFSKVTLRNALAQEGLIDKASNGRWTRQVRGDGGRRTQVWEFDAASFNALCGITIEEETPKNNGKKQVTVSKIQV